MGLLVWIKSISSIYDSPPVSYVCGQTMPWQFEDSLPYDPARLLDDPLIKCLEKPSGCTAENYYRNEIEEYDDYGVEVSGGRRG